MPRFLPIPPAALLLLVMLVSPLTAQNGTLNLRRQSTSQGMVSRGHYEVFENRQARQGRTIRLNLVILHARSRAARPDPVFVLAGGPGQAAASLANRFSGHWIRRHRDIVLVSQRGTDLDNRLAFERPETGDNLQQYLEPFIVEEAVGRNLGRLRQSHDLRLYSTPLAMDDLNEVRQALGYQRINLMGASYGTRAALVYIRRHGDTVRTALLDGCAPIEFRNPLHHAEGAQRALDRILDEVESVPAYRNSYPDLRQRFAEVLDRFSDGHTEPVWVHNGSTGRNEQLILDREAFVDALRFQMYYLDTCRKVPWLIDQAWRGNFQPLVVDSIRQKLELSESVAIGMLMSVTAAEDVARIDPAEIDEWTGDSFMGAGRVRRQMAAARIWPHSELPDDFGEPVSSEVPVLIFSGDLDPVTPPQWGQRVADRFPNSLHVVAPAAHGVHGSCPDRLRRQFLEAGSVKGLDTSCVTAMKLPPLYLPGSRVP